MGWLRTQSNSGKRSPKQDKLVNDVCLTPGVELFKGQLVLHAAPEKVAQSVIRLGQAAVRLSDLWFTMRTRRLSQSRTKPCAICSTSAHGPLWAAKKRPLLARN